MRVLVLVLFICWFACRCLANQPPVVSNVNVQQFPEPSELVSITYDVSDSDGDTLMITLQVSSDSGATWTVPVVTLSGDTGQVLSGVNYEIIWNAGLDHDDQTGNQYVARISADDGIPDIPGFTLMGVFEGHAYYLSHSDTCWNEAKIACQNVGGYLVCIGSAEENQFLSDAFTASYEWVWIGYTDEVTEGDWRWVNGQPRGYENWSTGEPNNSGNEDHATIEMNRPYRPRGAWNDYIGTANEYFILEIP